jgi:hypothetical protein
MRGEDKTRHRMIVEEVGNSTENSAPVVQSEPVEEIKEKVEELQNLTESISEDVEKSAEVQEDLAIVAEEVVNTTPQDNPPSSEQNNYTPQIKSGGGPNPLLIIIPGIFLLGALLGGIYFYQKGVSGIDQKPTPTPNYNYENTTTTSKEATPSPTPSQLDLSKYSINIMNGSGVSGQANVAKDLLTKAGFSINKTGNASSYDYTKTVVKSKVNVPAEFLVKLKETLSKNYVLDTSTGSLATSSADSVQVIIGSTKAN